MVFALPGEPGLAELVGDFKIHFQDSHGDFYWYVIGSPILLLWCNFPLLQWRMLNLSCFCFTEHALILLFSYPKFYSQQLWYKNGINIYKETRLPDWFHFYSYLFFSWLNTISLLFLPFCQTDLFILYIYLIGHNYKPVLTKKSHLTWLSEKRHRKLLFVLSFLGSKDHIVPFDKWWRS